MGGIRGEEREAAGVQGGTGGGEGMGGGERGERGERGWHKTSQDKKQLFTSGGEGQWVRQRHS